MSPKITILVYRNNELINERTFSQPTIKIGRLASTDLQVNDSTVSRVHCVIELYDDGTAGITDVGSTAGVLLNGVKISRSSLHNGDEIILGKTKLIVKLEEEAAEKSPDPAAVSGKGVDDDLVDEEVFADPRLSAVRHYQEVFEAPYTPDAGATFDNRLLEITVTLNGQPLGVHSFNMKKERVLLGSSHKCDLNYSSDGLPQEDFPVIKKAGDDFAIVFPDQLPGVVEFSGARKTLSELQLEKRAVKDPDVPNCYQYTLVNEARAHLEFPYYHLWIRYTSRPPVIPTGIFQKMDYNLLTSFLASLVIVITFIAGLFLYPFAARESMESIEKAANKFVQIVVTPAEEVEDKLLEDLKKDKKGESGAKAAGKEGKMGKKDAPKVKDMRSAIKAIKPQDKEIVMKQGLLGLLNAPGGAAFGAANPFGGTGLGGDLRNALGGVVGRNIGDSWGLGGLGLRGMGPGGGGDSFTSIGLGTVGTRGRGAGEGGYGAGYGLGTKADKNINISTGAPIILGSLDRELIRRVIHAHRNEIKYCYTRQLAINETLQGKIRVTFTIGGDGRVLNSSVKETTMNNFQVENCLVQKIKTWKFPEPKGGGIVIVTYPFIFTPSG
ncbi:MAG: hypothetical protein Kow0090_14720 [Myxococcota bacterium]